MTNRYTKFAATLFLLQVVTIIFSVVFILRHFPPIHLMNAVLSLIIAILLFKVKWKWIPSIGILYGLLFTVLTVPSFIISMTRNIDPEYNAMLEASNPFIGISFLSVLFVVTILLASIAGLVTNFHPNHQVPAWFPKVKGAVYGATIMGLFISFYLQLHWVTGINKNTINKLPTIVMKPDSVEPANMELTAGEPIVFQIRNESENKCHILSFPELNTSVHMENGRTGLIVLDPKPGTYRYECKSHHAYYSDKIKGELTVVPK